MELDIQPRRGGKTERLVEWVLDAEEGQANVMVVPNQQRRKQILDQFPKLQDWQVVTSDEALQGSSGIWYRMAGKANVALGIDDVDLLLESLFRGIHIERATASSSKHARSRLNTLVSREKEALDKNDDLS